MDNKEIKGINLSNIKYNENGEIIFDEDIDLTSGPDIEEEINKPITKEDKTKALTSEEKAEALSQSMEEIERDMKAQEKHKLDLDTVVYMNEKNTMFISCVVFTLLGLSFGTFVFSDYISCTLVGLLLGILCGRFLCKQVNKDNNDIGNGDINEE